MSVQLHDGLRLKDPQLSVYDAIAQLAPVVRSFVNTAKVKIIADGLPKVIDEPKPVETKPQTMIWTVMRESYDRRQMLLGVKHPDHDPLRFSIVFGQTAQGILLYPYPGQHQLMTHVHRMLPELFEEYGYWDNTDAPMNISKEQWDQREQAWLELCNDRGVLTDLPLWALTSTQSYPFDISVLNKHQETLDSFHPQAERLQRSLVQIAMTAMTKDSRVKDQLRTLGDLEAITNVQRNAQQVARAIMDAPAWRELVSQSLPQTFPSVISRWSQRPASALNSVIPELRAQVELLAMDTVNNSYDPLKD